MARLPGRIMRRKQDTTDFTTVERIGLGSFFSSEQMHSLGEE